MSLQSTLKPPKFSSAMGGSLWAFWFFTASPAFSLESTKILPKGVRSVNLRVVDTQIDQKTSPRGKSLPLAEPLNQDLTFKKIAQGEDLIKGNLLRGFLLGEGIDLNSTVGRFDADLKAHVQVTAPIFSYGLSDRWTIALAVPYYRAATNVAIGFQPNENGQAFLNALSRPETGQTAAAREAGEKINQAVSRLNDKLTDHGFAALGPWENEGLGDITVAGKFLALDRAYLSLATTTGLVAPSGRVDDPNILTDLPFGDGQWDVFSQVAMDQPIGNGVFFNQHAKYTYQFAGRKDVREVLEEEKIEVPVTSTQFKLGDKVEAGVAVQWQPTEGPVRGVVAGLGLNALRKMSDRYQEVPLETAQVLAKDTDLSQQTAEATIGYSTVPLFRQNRVPLPLEVKLTLIRPLASRNSPVSNLTQLDLSLFF